MSPKYESVPAEPQLTTRPRASVAAQTQEPSRPATPDPPPPPPTPAAEDLVTITVAIPQDVRTALKVACAVNGVTIKQATAEAFRMWLAVKAPSQGA